MWTAVCVLAGAGAYLAACLLVLFALGAVAADHDVQDLEEFTDDPD